MENRRNTTNAGAWNTKPIQTRENKKKKNQKKYTKEKFAPTRQVSQSHHTQIMSSRTRSTSLVTDEQSLSERPTFDFDDGIAPTKSISGGFVAVIRDGAWQQMVGDNKKLL